MQRTAQMLIETIRRLFLFVPLDFQLREFEVAQKIYGNKEFKN